MGTDDLEHVNMHAAKTQLSRLVERVEAGEEIVIDRAGKPAAMLVPVAKAKPGKRKLGVWQGRMELPSDGEWKQMDEEIEQLFEESEIFPGENKRRGNS